MKCSQKLDWLTIIQSNFWGHFILLNVNAIIVLYFIHHESAFY